MREPLDLAYPFTGWWLVQNSPANRVPSHGAPAFASSQAIDFVPVSASGRTARIGLRALVGTEPPERFPGFGRELLAPVDGVVLAAHGGEIDHPSFRGLRSLGYAATQRRRASAGWRALAGNHVLIETRGTVVALCHLQQDSVRVRAGQRVRAGDPIARCGNSGNSTEPHVHIQASEGADFGSAAAVPITFGGSLPVNGRLVHL
jgi:murein DD-endopeptidase MepM/ murein hydrolase activator NlpD